MPEQTRRDARAAANAQPTKKPVGRRIGLIIAIIAIVLLALGAWLAFKALTVKNELEAAQAQVAAVQDGSADMATALADMGVHAAAASSAAADPVWRVAEFVPIAGDNLRAVRLAAESLDVLANDLAEPILADDASGAGVMPRALAAMTASQDRITSLADEVAAAAASPFLIGPVRGGIDQVAEVMVPAGAALAVLPGMLGADGPMNYLMVFQNNAESLPLGGSAASQTLIHVEDGAISIQNQASSASFVEGVAVDVPVDQSAIDLYSDYLVKYVNTTVSRPDFPTAASLLEAFWNRDIDATPVDGVVSINPLALQRVLKATGPITVGDIELTDKNAVRILLSDAYVMWDAYADPEASDLFFASVATQVFNKVSEGSFNVKDMAWAVNASIDNGDILFHANDAAVQDLVKDQLVSGILPADNETSSTLGVYFRDTSASKIDFYMDSTIDVSATCSGDTSQFTAATELHLNLTQDEADALPRYVKSRHWGSEKFRTEVFVYGPAGTSIESATVDGRDARPTRTDVTDLGRPVAAFETYLQPGERATVTATFTGQGEFGDLALRSTPMVRASTETLTGSPCG